MTCREVRAMDLEMVEWNWPRDSWMRRVGMLIWLILGMDSDEKNSRE